MKYIIVQDKCKCINVYQITMFYVKELSVYAKIGEKKIRLGTFNTKEDAFNEYNTIINNLRNSSENMYSVHPETFWIQNRMEIEINDILNNEADIPTVDYEEDDDTIEEDDDADIEAEESEEIENEIEDDYSNDIDNE